MSLACPDVRARLEGYSAESLPPAERRAVRAHLASCVPCREEAVASDPLFLFATTEGAPVSSEETVRVLSAVRAGIALRNAERRLETTAGRRRIGALVSAAAAVALTLLVPGAPPRRQPAAGLRPERAAVKANFVPAGNPAPAGEDFQRAGGAQRYPADATIYDFNPGAGQPRVVWIVDRSIDI